MWAELELARLVTELAPEYNRAWLVVERNNHGSGVLALAGDGLRLRAGLPAGRAGGMADDFGEPAGGAGAAGRGAGGGAGALHEPTIAGGVPELCALPNGRTGARAGTHDDRVMAMAIGLGARAELMGRKTRD